MHGVNPFTEQGHALHDHERRLNTLEGSQHEIHSLRGTVDRLEHTIRQLESDIVGLRSELQALREEAVNSAAEKKGG